jgi:hypothetical protein
MLMKKGVLSLMIGSALIMATPLYAAVTLKLSHNHNRQHPVHHGRSRQRAVGW